MQRVVFYEGGRLQIKWRLLISRVLSLIIGALIAAIAVIVFYSPFEIAPAGVSGLAVILNKHLGTPIGLMIIVGNIPIMYMAYRVLGGWGSVFWSICLVVGYSLCIDLLTPYLPAKGISDDVLLNTIYAGIIGGIGGGIVYRTGVTFGGTSTLARILQIKLGTPITSTYLYANIGIVLLAGLFLGWESALYSLVALFMEGVASDYIMEGPSVIRTATIITDSPREVSDAILHRVQRGVTGWEAKGMYTDQTRHILFVTILRTQSNTLKDLVQAVDPDALIIIGQGHVAYGEGFKRARH